jgi:hypothetical protein
MSSQEILQLLARLDAAIETRRQLLDKQRHMIAEFKRTGVKADAFEWAVVCDSLRINEQTIGALRATLDALRGSAVQ